VCSTWLRRSSRYDAWRACAGAIAARQNFTDADIVQFLTNVECLEGLFDTWGAFGRGFLNDLERGGPKPIGARKANLSEAALPYAQEIALQEQARPALRGHPCRLSRQSAESWRAGATQPQG